MTDQKPTCKNCEWIDRADDLRRMLEVSKHQPIRKDLLLQLATIYESRRDYSSAAKYYEQAGEIRTAIIRYAEAGEFSNALRISTSEKERISLECRMVQELKGRFLLHENFVGHLNDHDAECDARTARNIGDQLAPIADKYGLLKSLYAEGLAYDSRGLTGIVYRYLTEKGRAEEYNNLVEEFGLDN